MSDTPVMDSVRAAKAGEATMSPASAFEDFEARCTALERADAERRWSLLAVSPELLFDQLVQICAGRSAITERESGQRFRICAIDHKLPDSAEMASRGTARIYFDGETDCFMVKLVSPEFEPAKDGCRLPRLEAVTLRNEPAGSREKAQGQFETLRTFIAETGQEKGSVSYQMAFDALKLLEEWTLG
jgi:hypothetical protein